MIDRIAPIALRPIAGALHKDAQPRTDLNNAPSKASGLKSQISDIAREASSAPVGIDAAKVAVIRDAISNGSYKVDAPTTAASILKFYRS